MINLFHLNEYHIPLEKFDHHLHGSVVEEFENEFCKYVGAKYACSVNSATNALFLSLKNKMVKMDEGKTNFVFPHKAKVSIPTTIPSVVANAIIHAEGTIDFIDTPEWVGDSYTFYDFGDYKIIDSAQRVDRNQYSEEADPNDLMIFSFYPTKPVGGIDGGIIVSDDKQKIDWFKEACMNGMKYSANNWEREQKFVGWKMYMSSAQAFVALSNLRKLDDKKEKVARVREYYNSKFNLDNTSDHLYRINLENRDEVLSEMKSAGIVCGIHYETLHDKEVFKNIWNLNKYPLSEEDSRTTLSIPLHEALTDKETGKIYNELSKFI